MTENLIAPMKFLVAQGNQAYDESIMGEWI